MKIPLTFKSPDVINEAIDNAKENLGPVSKADEAAFKKVCDKFIEHGEYLLIEIDTKTKTATVLTVSR